MSNDKQMFFTWDENDPLSKEAAFAKANHGEKLNRSTAGNSFQNIV